MDKRQTNMKKQLHCPQIKVPNIDFNCAFDSSPISGTLTIQDGTLRLDGSLIGRDAVIGEGVVHYTCISKNRYINGTKRTISF